MADSSAPDKGDTDVLLLRKIVIALGGTADDFDTYQTLLYKWAVLTQ